MGRVPQSATPARVPGAAQVAAMIGGLTIDAVTPHGGLSIERLREILRAHLRMLLTAERRR